MAATTNVTEATSEVSIEVNEGQLVRLEAAATSVFIANPDVADVSIKSQRLVYIFGQKPGETTLYAVDRNDRMIASIRIQVNHNLSRLNQSLDALVTDGNVDAISVDGGIVLTGNVLDPVDAENARRLAFRFIDEKKEEIINQIKVTAPNQVNLRVRIAEVQRNITRHFGFNWDAGFRNNDMTFGIATGDNPVHVNNLPIRQVTDIDDATLSPAAVPFGSGPLEELDQTFITRQTAGIENLFFGGAFGNWDVNNLIDALATDGLVTILAEPNLTALSGETASFLAGGEFPIPLVEDGSVKVEFKEFGVSLSFTPTTLTQNRISMRVRPEVSQLSTAGQVEISNFVIPGLTTRRAETTVELASGQSFAIAGLFLDSSLEDLRKLPGLSSIPILGQLFDSDRFERHETELVIIVTPYLVRPVKGPLPLPTDPYVKRPEVAVRTGNTAQSPYAPQTIPLNDGSPLAQNSAAQVGFIVE
ncbi:MAG: type II and III secretion system protein family protein [Rhodospirillales bacterium]|nr:type II and III secretion system protein family protein [Rhodospirillales bacterium]